MLGDGDLGGRRRRADRLEQALACAEELRGLCVLTAHAAHRPESLEALGHDSLVAAVVRDRKRLPEQEPGLVSVGAAQERDTAEIRERERDAPRVLELLRETQSLLEQRSGALVVAPREVCASQHEHGVRDQPAVAELSAQGQAALEE